MSVTTPSDINNGGWDGSTDTTDATNLGAHEAGWPIQLEDGTIINVVDKRLDPQKGTIAIDADGNEYRTDALGYVYDADSNNPEIQAGTDQAPASESTTTEEQ